MNKFIKVISFGCSSAALALAATTSLTSIIKPLETKAEEGNVTLAYSGSSSSNLGDGNSATTLGLSNSDWNVIADKGSASNNVGINKAGDFRLYYHADGSNTLTVTSINSWTITTIDITYTSANYNNGKVLVGGNVRADTDGSTTDAKSTHSISATSFVLTNGNTSNVQVRVSSIVINYDTEGGSGSSEPPATTYTVTYNANGGTGTMDPTEDVVAACTYTAPDGEQFKEWNTSSTGNGDKYSVGSTVTSDVTLYAIWETQKTLSSIALSGTYKTTFTSDDTFSFGGTVTATYDDESNKDVTNDVSFTGYDLSTAGDQTVTVSYTENNITKTATYGISVSYAKGHQNNPYTVSEAYDAIEALGNSGTTTVNNGKVVYVTGVVTGTPVSANKGNGATFDITDGVKTINAYSITGASATDKESQFYVEAGYTVKVSGALIYYYKNNSPKYEVGYAYGYASSIVSSIAPKFTLTYNDNGATSGNVPAAAEYSKYTSATILGNTGSLEKTGYQFVGWNTKADGTGTRYSSGDDFEITANTTLYAEWLSTSPSITVVSELSGYTGQNTVLDFTYGYINEANLSVVASNSNVTVEDDLIAENGEALVTISFVSAGSSTLSFKNGNDVLASCAVTINQSEVSITGLPSTGNVYTTEELNLGSKITVTSTGSYNNNVTWSSSDESVATVSSSGVVTGVAAGQATITVASVSNPNVAQSCIVTVAKQPSRVTWDLSTKSYTTETDKVTWSSEYAVMTNETGAGSTSATSYLGGDSNKRTSSRMYANNSFKISPTDGYNIVSIIFRATSINYATALKDSDWTNATASAQETMVTVIPTDGESDISAVIGATCGFTEVKVLYNKTWAREFLDTFTCSGITVQNPNGAITVQNPTDVWEEFSESLTDELKTELVTLEANDSGSVNAKAMARYDLVIRKYGTGVYRDFIGRFSKGGANATNGAFLSMANIDLDNSATIVPIILLTTVAAAGGIFAFAKRRKEQ